LKNGRIGTVVNVNGSTSFTSTTLPQLNRPLSTSPTGASRLKGISRRLFAGPPRLASDGLEADLYQSPNRVRPVRLIFLFTPPSIDRIERWLLPTHADLRPLASRFGAATAFLFCGNTN
jgi:hypothetical protein